MSRRDVEQLPVSAPFIEVHSLSTKSRRLSPILVRRGDSTSLAVRVRGNPAPAVTWYVNRKPVSAVDERFRLECDGRGRHVLNIEAATGDLDAGVWVVASNEAGQDSARVNVKTYRVLPNLGSVIQDEDASATLPRGARIRRRKYEIDDVINNVPMFSLDRALRRYHSLPRDIDVRRQQKLRAPQSEIDAKYRMSAPPLTTSTRLSAADDQTDVNQDVESFFHRRPAAVSGGRRRPTSQRARHSYTDNVAEEMPTPAVPAVHLEDDVTMASEAGNERRPPEKKSKKSKKLSLRKSSKAKKEKDKENQKLDADEKMEVSEEVTTAKRKKETSKSVKKLKKRASKTDEVPMDDGDGLADTGQTEAERFRQDKSNSRTAAEKDSLWEINGVKLWRFCAGILGTELCADVGRDVDIEKPSAERQSTEDTAFRGCDSALGDSVMSSNDDVLSEPSLKPRRETEDYCDETVPDFVERLQMSDIGHFVDGRNLYTWLAYGGYNNQPAPTMETADGRYGSPSNVPTRYSPERITSRLTDSLDTASRDELESSYETARQSLDDVHAPLAPGLTVTSLVDLTESPSVSKRRSLKQTSSKPGRSTRHAQSSSTMSQSDSARSRPRHRHKNAADPSSENSQAAPRLFVYAPDVDVPETEQPERKVPTGSKHERGRRRSEDAIGKSTSTRASSAELLNPGSRTLHRRESGYSSLPRSKDSLATKSSDALAQAGAADAAPQRLSRSCRSVADLMSRGYKRRRQSSSVEIRVARRSRSASRTRTRTLSHEWQFVRTTTTTEETMLPPPAAGRTLQQANDRLRGSGYSDSDVPTRTGSSGEEVFTQDVAICVDGNDSLGSGSEVVDDEADVRHRGTSGSLARLTMTRRTDRLIDTTETSEKRRSRSADDFLVCSQDIPDYEGHAGEDEKSANELSESFHDDETPYDDVTSSDDGLPKSQTEENQSFEKESEVVEDPLSGERTRDQISRVEVSDTDDDFHSCSGDTEPDDNQLDSMVRNNYDEDDDDDQGQWYGTYPMSGHDENSAREIAGDGLVGQGEPLENNATKEDTALRKNSHLETVDGVIGNATDGGQNESSFSPRLLDRTLDDVQVVDSQEVDVREQVSTENQSDDMQLPEQTGLSVVEQTVVCRNEVSEDDASQTELDGAAPADQCYHFDIVSPFDKQGTYSLDDDESQPTENNIDDFDIVERPQVSHRKSITVSEFVEMEQTERYTGSDSINVAMHEVSNSGVAETRDSLQSDLTTVYGIVKVSDIDKHREGRHPDTEMELAERYTGSDSINVAMHELSRSGVTETTHDSLQSDLTAVYGIAKVSDIDKDREGRHPIAEMKQTECHTGSDSISVDMHDVSRTGVTETEDSLQSGLTTVYGIAKVGDIDEDSESRHPDTEMEVTERHTGSDSINADTHEVSRTAVTETQDSLQSDLTAVYGIAKVGDIDEDSESRHPDTEMEVTERHTGSDCINADTHEVSRTAVAETQDSLQSDPTTVYGIAKVSDIDEDSESRHPDTEMEVTECHTGSDSINADPHEVNRTAVTETQDSLQSHLTTVYGIAKVSDIDKDRGSRHPNAEIVSTSSTDIVMPDGEQFNSNAELESSELRPDRDECRSCSDDDAENDKAYLRDEMGQEVCTTDGRVCLPIVPLQPARSDTVHVSDPLKTSSDGSFVISGTENDSPTLSPVFSLHVDDYDQELSDSIDAHVVDNSGMGSEFLHTESDRAGILAVHRLDRTITDDAETAGCLDTETGNAHLDSMDFKQPSDQGLDHNEDWNLEVACPSHEKAVQPAVRLRSKDKGENELSTPKDRRVARSYQKGDSTVARQVATGNVIFPTVCLHEDTTLFEALRSYEQRPNDENATTVDQALGLNVRDREHVHISGSVDADSLDHCQSDEHHTENSHHDDKNGQIHLCHVDQRECEMPNFVDPGSVLAYDVDNDKASSTDTNDLILQPYLHDREETETVGPMDSCVEFLSPHHEHDTVDLSEIDRDGDRVVQATEETVKISCQIESSHLDQTPLIQFGTEDVSPPERRGVFRKFYWDENSEECSDYMGVCVHPVNESDTLALSASNISTNDGLIMEVDSSDSNEGATTVVPSGRKQIEETDGVCPQDINASLSAERDVQSVEPCDTRDQPVLRIDAYPSSPNENVDILAPYMKTEAIISGSVDGPTFDQVLAIHPNLKRVSPHEGLVETAEMQVQCDQISGTPEHLIRVDSFTLDSAIVINKITEADALIDSCEFDEVNDSDRSLGSFTDPKQWGQNKEPVVAHKEVAYEMKSGSDDEISSDEQTVEHESPTGPLSHESIPGHIVSESSRLSDIGNGITLYPDEATRDGYDSDVKPDEHTLPVVLTVSPYEEVSFAPVSEDGAKQIDAHRTDDNASKELVSDVVADADKSLSTRPTQVFPVESGHITEELHNGRRHSEDQQASNDNHTLPLLLLSIADHRDLLVETGNARMTFRSETEPISAVANNLVNDDSVEMTRTGDRSYPVDLVLDEVDVSSKSNDIPTASQDEPKRPNVQPTGDMLATSASPVHPLPYKGYKGICSGSLIEITAGAEGEDVRTVIGFTGDNIGVDDVTSDGRPRQSVLPLSENIDLLANVDDIPSLPEDKHQDIDNRLSEDDLEIEYEHRRASPSPPSSSLSDDKPKLTGCTEGGIAYNDDVPESCSSASVRPMPGNARPSAESGKTGIQSQSLDKPEVDVHATDEISDATHQTTPPLSVNTLSGQLGFSSELSEIAAKPLVFAGVGDATVQKSVIASDNDFINDDACETPPQPAQLPSVSPLMGPNELPTVCQDKPIGTVAGITGYDLANDGTAPEYCSLQPSPLMSDDLKSPAEICKVPSSSNDELNHADVQLADDDFDTSEAPATTPQALSPMNPLTGEHYLPENGEPLVSQSEPVRDVAGFTGDELAHDGTVPEYCSQQPDFPMSDNLNSSAEIGGVPSEVEPNRPDVRLADANDPSNTSPQATLLPSSSPLAYQLYLREKLYETDQPTVSQGEPIHVALATTDSTVPGYCSPQPAFPVQDSSVEIRVPKASTASAGELKHFDTHFTGDDLDSGDTNEMTNPRACPLSGQVHFPYKLSEGELIAEARDVTGYDGVSGSRSPLTAEEVRHTDSDAEIGKLPRTLHDEAIDDHVHFSGDDLATHEGTETTPHTRTLIPVSPRSDPETLSEIELRGSTERDIDIDDTCSEFGFPVPVLPKSQNGASSDEIGKTLLTPRDEHVDKLCIGDNIATDETTPRTGPSSPVSPLAGKLSLPDHVYTSEIPTVPHGEPTSVDIDFTGDDRTNDDGAPEENTPQPVAPISGDVHSPLESKSTPLEDRSKDSDVHVTGDVLSSDHPTDMTSRVCVPQDGPIESDIQSVGDVIGIDRTSDNTPKTCPSDDLHFPELVGERRPVIAVVDRRYHDTELTGFPPDSDTYRQACPSELDEDSTLFQDEPSLLDADGKDDKDCVMSKHPRSVSPTGITDIQQLPHDEPRHPDSEAIGSNLLTDDDTNLSPEVSDSLPAVPLLDPDYRSTKDGDIPSDFGNEPISDVATGDPPPSPDGDSSRQACPSEIDEPSLLDADDKDDRDSIMSKYPRSVSPTEIIDIRRVPHDEPKHPHARASAVGNLLTADDSNSTPKSSDSSPAVPQSDHAYFSANNGDIPSLFGNEPIFNVAPGAPPPSPVLPLGDQFVSPTDSKNTARVFAEDLPERLHARLIQDNSDDGISFHRTPGCPSSPAVLPSVDTDISPAGAEVDADVIAGSRPDTPEVDSVDGLTVHDYGEMWSVFREVPLWIEILRATVVERHNNDPQISRLLARYPQLRPGTWHWSTSPRVDDLRRQIGLSEGDDGDQSEANTSTKFATLTNGRSFDVEPVVERCVLLSQSENWSKFSDKEVELMSEIE